MAPIACLPMHEMCRLPDLQRNAAKAWADMDDMGTPSPWTDYPADFKLWPDTPTPSALAAQPLPSPMLHQLPISQMRPLPAEFPEKEAPASLRLQTIQGPHPALAQTCPALTEMPVPPRAVGLPSETLYAAFAQTIPGQIPVPSSIGLPLQNNFSGYEADPTLHNVDESVVLQASQPWRCEFNGWNHAVVGPAFTSGIQWPNFSLPQHSPAPEQSQSLGEWQNSVEETTVIAEVEVAQHGAGQCRPCAWFWRAQGCRNGGSCSYCHLCPEGELKSRKKNKIAAMKSGALTPMSKKASSTATIGWGLKLDTLLMDKH